MPFLNHITFYPIKSLDGVSVTQVKVLSSGALECDREFAIFDEQGNFVNGKRNEKVHLLRSTFDLDARKVILQVQGTDTKRSFHIENDRLELEVWLSEFFGFPVKFMQNKEGGFPDDKNASGPTLIGTGTLEEVCTWFSGLRVGDMRIRFRANLEIGGGPAFWEDRLFGERNTFVTFTIGEVRFEGVNPCQRCAVPTRDPFTGEAYPKFQKIFATKREETLPSWATSSRFNHFYRVSVNTRIPPSEAGKVLKVGDEVKLLNL
jgi:hypothetical protein